MKKRIIFFILINIFFLFSLYAQVDAQIPKGQIQIIDNFENGNYWIWAGFDWDRYSGHKASWGCNLSQKHVTEGMYCMELLIEPVSSGSNAIWFYDGTQNLADGKYIVADFYNDSPIDYDVYLVLQATDNWEWLQTEVYTIPPGKHTIVFYVKHLNQHFNDIRRFNINTSFNQSYNHDSSLFVDNIILIK